METTEYIQYCEEIKGEEENSELSQERKYWEYFEEDVKNDIEEKVKREIEAEDEKKGTIQIFSRRIYFPTSALQSTVCPGCDTRGVSARHRGGELAASQRTASEDRSEHSDLRHLQNDGVRGTGAA